MSTQGQKDTGVPNTHVLDVHMEPPTDTNNIRARLMLKIPPNFSTKKKMILNLDCVDVCALAASFRIVPMDGFTVKMGNWMTKNNFFSGRHTLLTTVTRKYRACQLTACL